MGYIWNNKLAILYVLSLTAPLWITDFPLAASPWIREQKVMADDGEADDNFGWSCAIYKKTALVGAIYEDNSNGVDAGSAYVFQYDNHIGKWTQKQKLVASDGAAKDHFGGSVSIFGKSIIVGAEGGTGNANKSGAAYIFHYNHHANSWFEKQKLVATDGNVDDKFGDSVFISGKYAAVGAPRANGTENHSGAVYLYEYNHHSNSWEFKQKLTAADSKEDDDFGHFVAISGKRIIIGAPENKNDDGDALGAAYIFHYDHHQNKWVEQQKLTASDGEGDDEFGHWAAIEGKIAVVGAQYGNGNEEDSGAAYIFTYDSYTRKWTQRQKLIASDGKDDDLFGHAVSISHKKIICGSHGSNKDLIYPGAAYLFDYDHRQKKWVEKQKIVPYEAADLDHFGRSLFIHGHRMIIAANKRDDNGQDSGAAYIYKLHTYDGNN